MNWWVSTLPLLQLSHMAANALLDAKVDEEEGDADSQQAQQASQLAFEMLRRVATDASHGLSAGTPGVEGQGGPLSWVAVLQGRLASGRHFALTRYPPCACSLRFVSVSACPACCTVIWAQVPVFPCGTQHDR